MQLALPFDPESRAAQVGAAAAVADAVAPAERPCPCGRDAACVVALERQDKAVASWVAAVLRDLPQPSDSRPGDVRADSSWRRLLAFGAERGLDDLEVAAVAAAILARRPLIRAARPWFIDHLARQRRRLAWLLEQRSDRTDVVSECLGDRELLAMFAFWSTEDVGEFERALLAVRRHGGDREGVAAIRRAALAEQRRLFTDDASPSAATAADAATRALFQVRAWIESHTDEIVGKTKGRYPPSGRWAGRATPRFVGLRPTVLRNIVAAGGHDPDSVLEAWAERGLLLRDPSGRPRVQARVGRGGERAWLTAFPRHVLEAAG